MTDAYKHGGRDKICVCRAQSTLTLALSTRACTHPCQDEDGAMVVIYGLKAISGEASVTAAAGPRAKRTRAFDLAFELEWQARACDTHFSGRLLFSEVRSPLSDPEGRAPPGCDPVHSSCNLTPPGCGPLMSRWRATTSRTSTS